MQTALQAYVESKGHGGIEIARTADLFRRYAFIEQSCVRALAGWFLKHPDWECKIRLGYLLFSHAEHVYEHKGRLEELRGGHRHATLAPELQRLGEELIHAPDGRSFLAGLRTLALALREQYARHVGVADPAANAMEIRILNRTLPDLQDEIDELAGWLRQDGNREPDGDRTSEWSRYVEGLIQAAGGISGLEKAADPALSRPDTALFEWPAPIQFDDRLRHADLGTYESKVSLPLRERAIGEYEVYFNEFYAAALLASVMMDSWQIHAPRQYFMDIAHHFWDEVRHAEFGAIRLRELGIEPNKINMVLFEQSRKMPLIHRICYLALGLEVFFMPRKSERSRYYEQQGDMRSQLFADVDWSEEINHVNYGKRWIKHFLEEDARSVDDIQEEIAAYLDEFQKQLPKGKKAPW